MSWLIFVGAAVAAAPCTLQQVDLETERPIGPSIRVVDGVARAGLLGRRVAGLLDPDTAETRGGRVRASWDDEDRLLLVGETLGLVASYRFWDDGILAFEGDAGPRKFFYDLESCDRTSLMVAAAAAFRR